MSISSRVVSISCSMYVHTCTSVLPWHVDPASLRIQHRFSLMLERKDAKSFDVTTGHTLTSCYELFLGRTLRTLHHYSTLLFVKICQDMLIFMIIWLILWYANIKILILYLRVIFICTPPLLHSGTWLTTSSKIRPRYRTIWNC